MNINHLSKNTPLLRLPNQDYHWRVPVILALALLPIAYINMILFHTLSELFAIGIAVMSFVVSWHTYPFTKNRFLLFLGSAYFWVGMIDLTHTLTFQNIVGIKNITAGATIQLWINARFLEAIALLLASFSFYRLATPKKIFLSFGLVSITTTTLIFFHLYPEMFLADKGLTSAKIFSEYTIIGILICAAIAIRVLHPNIERNIGNLLLLSIALTISAELTFTLYSGLDEVPIIVGHLLKLFSFWAIYCALIESALQRPFHSLSQIVHSYDSVNEKTVIIDENGLIQHANQVAIEAFEEEIVGVHCHTLLHARSTYPNECFLCSALENRETVRNYEYKDSIADRWFEANLSPIHASKEAYFAVHSIRDITSRKRAEEQFNSLNRLYQVLSKTNQAIVQTNSEQQLFQRMCDIAVEFGSFKMAWIGTIEGPVVKPCYFAGAESGYLHETHMRIDDSNWAQGPVGTAAKTLDVACVNSVKLDPNFVPWREAAMQRGYGSLAAIPLLIKQSAVGVFTLYSQHEGVFDEGMLQLLRSLSKDISAALFNLEQAAQKREADATILRLSRALEQSANAVVITNIQGIIEYANPGFTDLTGYETSEALDQNVLNFAYFSKEGPSYSDITDTLKKGKSWQGKVKSNKKNGDAFWMMQTISPIKDEQGSTSHYVTTAADLTKLQEAQETIEQLAFYDSLTGLANRRLLMNRMVHDLASARRHNELLAVVLCDLDNFKNVNDSLGHEQGDELLKHVASVLSKNILDEDTAARLGGDEFVLIITGEKENQRVSDVSAAILNALAKPVEISGTQISVSSSIGIALYPQDGTTINELFRKADLAMYHAKELGKNQFQFFQEEMNEKARARLVVEQNLGKAIEQQEFELHYQPQIDLQSKALIGVEALIRWRHPDLGIIPPDRFIPIAEQTGLIELIGDWVIDQAFTDWEKMIKKGMPTLKMSVNVAAYQFKNADHLAEKIRQKLAMHQFCEAERFTLELTESTLVVNVETTAEALAKLKQQGVSISIDDFGTGYSSLNYLKRFPIDQLKIDRSFIQDILEDKNDEAITDAVITLAEKLELNVIAEGIEELEQSELLLAKGCQFGQGYYYYRPMPVLDILNLIARNT